MLIILHPARCEGVFVLRGSGRVGADAALRRDGGNAGGRPHPQVGPDRHDHAGHARRRILAGQRRTPARSARQSRRQAGRPGRRPLLHAHSRYARIE